MSGDELTAGSSLHGSHATTIRLAVIVPTYNESLNVLELYRRLDATLGRSGWEAIFVDDDSPDSTASVVRGVAQTDSRIRCVQRIGRRGLSSACIEGMLASSAPVLAVIDGDLQHDETMLPAMLAEIQQNGADIVIGTRYAAGGSTGNWDDSRRLLSRIATRISGMVLREPVSDPMSGFFMLKREVLEATVRDLSGMGFKILLDILSTARSKSYRVVEVPYSFRNRFAGESKLDEMVVWEFGMLLADKTVGRYLPVRFLMFSIVGGFGVLVHMAALTLMLKGFRVDFSVSQSVATGVAMVFNFAVNNFLTYRDKRLVGLAWFRGLVSFMIACSIGALANVGIATYLFENRTQWMLAAVAGVVVGAVWNFAVTQIYTWGRGKSG